MNDVKLHMHIGTADDMAQRFVQAWNQAEAGEAISENHLTVMDLASLLANFTPKRLALLHYLRHNPAASVANLARALGRDYKRVHQDVETLTALGLVERGHDGMHVTVDEIQASMRL